MKILDKYILKKFLSTFIFVVIMLVTIISIIDFTEKTDDFTKNNAPLREIVKYYLNFMPYIANLISPITVFIATVFVTARMASHSEVIAILSSGVSFKRMLVPYIIGSALLGILTFFLIEFVIPKGNKIRVAFENQYVKEKFDFDGNVHLKIGPNTYAYIQEYNNDMNVGIQFTLETIEGTTMKAKLKTDKIEWNDKKKCWHIDNYTIRTFDGEKETIKTGTGLDTVLSITPKDFGSTYLLHETFDMFELDNYIKKLKDRGAENIEVYLIEKYERYTYPFAIIILTVIGVIVAARKTREGVGYRIAFGFLLAFIYIIFVLMSRTIAGVGSIGPLMASWIPNIIFSIIGLMMYKTVPK